MIYYYKNNRESAFLIQDMFPITSDYIEREYSIAGNHLMLTSEHVVCNKNGVILEGIQGF